MTISVSLKGLDNTAYLEGDASAYVSVSGALEGNFALVVLGTPSSSLVFGGTDGIAALAVRIGKAWQLVEMRAQAWFTWSQRTYVTASANAAMTVGFSVSRVKVPAEPDAVAIVSMEDIGGSIIPDVLPQNPREFLFPFDGSVQAQTLIGLDWPEQGQRRDGFYIKPRANNRARLSLGTTSSEFTIKHRDEVFLSVLARNEIFASAPAEAALRGDSLLEIEHWTAGQAVAYVDISAAKDPVLRFAGGPTGSGELELGAQQVAVSGNVVCARSFLQSRVEVRVEGAHAAATKELGTTAATGPQDRFSFAMELPRRADLRKARIQMVYQGPLQKAYDKESAFLERFNGVRVRGLGDARGIQALLDADVVVFDLLETDDRFHLLAGTADAVPITGMSAALATTPSLQPKFDPETGTRRLDIAVGEMALRSKPTQDGTSPVSVNARSGTLHLNAPSLVADPVGVTARDAKNEHGSYAEWSLGLNKDAGFDALSFVLDDNGLSAPRAINRYSAPVVRDADKEWLAKFQTENPNIEYVSVEEENMTVWIDTWFGKAEYTKKKTKIKVEKTPTGKEKRAYTQFFVTLGYALVEGALLLLNGKWRVLGAEKLFIDLDKLDEETGSDFVKQNSLKDLLVTYDFSKGAPIKARFEKWVEDNRPEPKDTHSRLLLPVGANVGVVLWEKTDEAGATERWMDTIAQGIVCPDDQPGCDPDTMLALDFSTESGLGPGDIGRDKNGNPWTSWSQIPEEDKILWPKARAVKNDGSKDNNKKGPRLDPSDRMWRGILFRNVPASIMIPEFLNETVTAKYPVIKQLLDLLQNRLLVHYGWRDANGATFSAGLVEKRKITPDSWDGILELYVDGLTVQGAPFEGKASTIVQAGGTVSLKAPWIGGDPDDPDAETPGIEGSFQLDLTNEEEVLKSLRVRLTGTGYEGPTIMPGFKKVKVLDFDTDFKTVNVVLALTADDTLSAALPFLADDEPMRASVYYNLSDDNTERDKNISLLLPTEIETKLFGRWDFTISHASFVWDDTQASEDFLLRFRGRLNLGLPALSSLTADVTVRRSRKAGSAWETAIELELQGISVDLQIGDTRVQGGFEWARLPSDGSGLEEGPIPADDLVEAGREREFFASLLVQGGIFGNGWKLLVKSGNEAAKTYFVGLLEADISIGLGSMALERPALFLAHDADLYDSNKQPQLEKAFSDGRNDIIKSLRPTFDDQNTPMKYLSKWKPNDQMGTLVAVSGYLDTQSGLAEPASTEEYITSIAYSDQGYFRVDAHAKLLGLPYFQRFALTLNTKRKYIEAGFAFPELAFSATSRKFLVNPGFYALGASYGGPFKVKSSLGWPALTGENDYERDWSRATMVRIEGLWPINTFWGGVQTEVDFGDPKRLYFGFAVRAGWTWSYELNAADIVKGRAELGIALGGVFEFEFQWDRAQNAFVPIVDIERPNHAVLAEEAWALTSIMQDDLKSRKSAGTIRDEEAECIDFCLRLMETAAEKTSRFDVAMRASIYADAWGSGSIEFLGVTIVAASLRAYVRFLACGSVNAGIQKLKGTAGFEFSVTILCVTYRTTARLEIVLKDDPCTIIGGNSFRETGIELPRELKLIKEVA